MLSLKQSFYIKISPAILRVNSKGFTKEELSRKGYQVEIKAVYSDEALRKLRGAD